MIVAFLAGMAVMAYLHTADRLDVAIALAGFALVGCWLREANLHLLREQDRQVALERLQEWFG